MAEETQMQEVGKAPSKRKLGHKTGSNKSKKKSKVFHGGTREKVRKMDPRMKKLFRKRARDYNSDDEEDEERELEAAPVIRRQEKERSREKVRHGKGQKHEEDKVFDEKSSDEEGEDGDEGVAGEENEVSEDEDGEMQPGITRFAEGCKAFRMAFKKITKKSGSDDVLGPVLSAHKKLVVEKLAEEEEERKVKGDAKKEKHVVKEKGHVKPENFLDSHEKFLIGVATKGVYAFHMCIIGLAVVKLFNAVNKAQNAQKGLNPSRSKDAKALYSSNGCQHCVLTLPVISKRRKEAFFSELGKAPFQSADVTTKAGASTDGDGPAWAPLRDNYMLTNSKLKDWDKLPEAPAADDTGVPSDSSSDDD
ncbi:hypothetical protein RJ640_011872 [Escallonia rubra]|uniref:RRP15-like protein n=1 Tax=Escallonia rubra TaxID=112253 RepID=A0AA88RBP3_9ASTE|nr:hypothetical protein RJ640_011872 [Escallonia rubra]